MKRSDVKVGNVYVVRVGALLSHVRITEDRGTVSPLFSRVTSKHRGWVGVNLRTNREVYIRTAGRLRKEVVA
jgi:hypothetical protein